MVKGLMTTRSAPLMRLTPFPIQTILGQITGDNIPKVVREFGNLKPKLREKLS